MSTDVEQLAVNAIKALSIDAVQKANSGHPGMPMGMADLAVVLWSKFLVVDPDEPLWPDRDRFVLSNGHGSMLLYSLLHLAGFPMSMDDIKAFRQLGSKTPGHPEIDQEIGVETTTGPLGQGFATGVGMAIAEEHLRSKLGTDLVDHRIYGFVSDGDLMEGVAAEAASLAGHLELGKITYLYDDNAISLVGPTSLAFSEDVPGRFAAYGWHTLTVDGHDRPAVAQAIEEANADPRPSLISCKTHIGHGSPNKQDTAGAHGSPLGEEEIALVKEGMGWELPPFEVPDEVYAFFTTAMNKGREAHAAWKGRLEGSSADSRAAWAAHWSPQPVSLKTPGYDAGAKQATRAISGKVLQDVAAMRNDLIGGAADLASSTNTLIGASGDFSVADRAARNVRFGVREHAMGAAANGITVHGGLRGYTATFLTFSDYMRPAIRLAALMKTPSIFVFTHDSVFLGEDGPTHQSIEHVAALRTIPNLWVIRPGDPAEVAGAWELAVNRTEGPTALIFTRQGVPVESAGEPSDVAKGAYVARDGGDVTMVATGSELNLALAAADLLAQQGTEARVVSMPCVEAFSAQGDDYRRSLIPAGVPAVSIEAGTTWGWDAIVGREGLKIGIDTFGESAPASVLAEHYGLTPAAVAEKVSAHVAR